MIRCGHCRDIHETVAEVLDCAAEEYAPVEICCPSCDGLLGYGDAGSGPVRMHAACGYGVTF